MHAIAYVGRTKPKGISAFSWPFPASGAENPDARCCAFRPARPPPGTLGRYAFFLRVGVIAIMVTRFARASLAWAGVAVDNASAFDLLRSDQGGVIVLSPSCDAGALRARDH